MNKNISNEDVDSRKINRLKIEILKIEKDNMKTKEKTFDSMVDSIKKIIMEEVNKIF